MAQKNLESLFHDTLKDIYYAERKISKTLSRMARGAQSEELKATFQQHKEEPTARSSASSRSSR
jgi:ferritin-like metal-binding protein YciE